MGAALDQPGFLFTVLMFILMIGPLVFVHELGHYLMGRLFDTKIDSFSIGFGRQIAGWTDRRGTRWQVSMLPLGGYVKFAGDANAAGAGSVDLGKIDPADRPHLFAFKPLWQRTLIVLAGPLINFLFAIGIFAAFIAIYGHAFTPSTVSAVQEGSPAAEAGLAPGDRITAIGARSIDRFEEMVQAVAINPGVPLEVDYVRGGEARTTVLVPARVEEVDRFGNSYEIGRIGIYGTEREVVRRGPFETLYYASEEVVLLTRSMIDTLVQIVTGRRSLKELGGPLKIAQVSGQQATLGLANFINLMALISINLGFINLLPIPMLDGGHLALYAAEAIRRKPVSEKAQEWAFMTGFALVVSFMLLVTWNDLASFGVWRHVAGLLG